MAKKKPQRNDNVLTMTVTLTKNSSTGPEFYFEGNWTGHEISAVRSHMRKAYYAWQRDRMRTELPQTNESADLSLEAMTLTTTSNQNGGDQ